MKQLLLILLLFYFIFMIFLYLQQKNFIFYPTRTKHQLKDNRSKEFSLIQETATLNGWLINHNHVSQRLIIYYGGNAEDIFYSIDTFHNFADTSALLINYRGYGTSSGTPSEENLFADALAIFDEVNARYNTQKVWLMGRSLGSGVATYVASQRDIAGLILITPFDSIESIAKKQYPFMPVSLLLQHKFRSIDHAPKIHQPTLIIYGGKDRIVPPANTERLIKYLSGNKKIVLIEEAEHNNIEMFPEYNLAILKFIQ